MFWKEHFKATIGRGYVEITKYEHLNIGCRKEKNGSKAGGTKSEEERQEHYKWQQKRKAKEIRQLMEINFCPMQSSFVTLTFDKQPDSVTKCNRCLRNMIRSLDRKYNRLLYLAVLEMGEAERLHYHVIFNVVYSNQFEQDVQQAWKHGTELDVQSAYDIVGLSWYMTKQFWEDNNLLYGCKRYLRSNKLQGVEKICSWKEEKVYRILETLVKDAKEQRVYSAEHEKGGKVEYKTYYMDIGMYSDYVVAVRK